MKKIHYLAISVSLFALTAGALVLSGIQKNWKMSSPTIGDEEDVVLTLDDEDTPDGIDDNFVATAQGTVKTSAKNDVTLNFVNVKKADDEFVTLAPRGMIYNFGTGDNAVTGLTGIKYTGSGTLFARTAKGGQAGGAVLNDLSANSLLTSGVKKTFETSDYFQIIAGEGGAVIQTLELTYSCIPASYDVRNLSGTYTGVGGDTSIYKLVVDSVLDANNKVDVTIDSLDKEAGNIHLTGKAEMLSATQAKCTFVYNTYNIYYTMNVSADKHSLTYVSKSDDVGGAAASQVTTINFNRVYNVEDFESYSETGNGFDSKRGASSLYSMSGLRSAFYSDYYGSNTVASPVGGTGWSMMGSTDYLQFTSTLGRGETKKAGIFKGNANSLRYISMNSYPGVPQVIGKGTTLSFWAKGPFKSNLTDPSTANATIKVFAFYNSKVTPSNQGTRTEKEFTITAGSDWAKYEMPLDSSKYYFGFAFFCKQTGDTYTIIDDVQIYTADPDATWVPVTGVAFADSSVEVEAGKNLALSASVVPANATIKGLSYESNNTAVATVDNKGVITGVAPGTATITATSTYGSFTDTCTVTVTDAVVYLSGTFISHVTVNIGVSATFPIVIASGNMGYLEFAFNGKTTGVTSYTNDGSSFSIVTKNDITFKVNTTNYTVKAGTISGSITDGTFKSCSFSGTQVNGSDVTPTNNGSIDFVKQTGSNSLFNNCDGTRAELQEVFDRRYRPSGGSWTMDVKNADKVDASTAYYMDGTGSLKFRGYSGSSNDSSLILKGDANNDMPSAAQTAYDNLSFWVYNSTGSAITLDMYIYKASNFGSYQQLATPTIQPGQWTFITAGYGSYSSRIYNIQIRVSNVPQESLYYDNFCLYDA